MRGPQSSGPVSLYESVIAMLVQHNRTQGVRKLVVASVHVLNDRGCSCLEYSPSTVLFAPSSFGVIERLVARALSLAFCHTK